jgi:hypothetical protein
MKHLGLELCRKFSATISLISLLWVSPVWSQSNNSSAQTSALTNEISQSGFRYRDSVNNDEAESNSVEVFQGEGEDQIITSDYIAILTMFAAGAVTGAMIKAKPLPTDVMIGAGAGLAFVAGEVLSTMNHNEDIEVDKRFELKTNNGVLVDHEQIEALKQQKAAYEKINETSKYKLYLQGAAAAGYLAAAGVAMSKQSKDIYYFGKCQADISKAMGEFPGHCAIKFPPADPANAALHATCQGQASSCMPQLTIANTKVGEIMAMDVLPGPSTQQATQLQTLVTETNTALTTVTGTCAGFPGLAGLTECQRNLTDFSINDVAGATNVPVTSPVAMLGIPPSKYEIFFEVMDFFFPAAHAGPYSKYGLGAAGAGLLLGIMVSSKGAMDQFVSTPSKRAILWAALAALAGATAYTTYQIMAKMDENIEKIDALLNRMRELDNTYTPTGTTTNVGETPINTIRPQSSISTNITPPGQTVFPCAGGTAPPCPDLSKAITNSGEIKGIDPEFAGAANAIGEIGNSIQGQGALDSGTISKAASLSGRQGALRKKLEKLNKKINAFRAKNGLPKVSLKNQSKKLASTLQNRVRAKLKSKPKGASSLANFFGGSVAPSLEGDKKSAVANKEEVTDKKAKRGSAVKSKKGGYFKLFGNNNGNDEFQEIDTSDLGGTHDEESPDDIVENNGTSLWQIITVRYLKSGYPRLLEEEK